MHIVKTKANTRVKKEREDCYLKAHLVPTFFPVWGPCRPALPRMGATGAMWLSGLERWELRIETCRYLYIFAGFSSLRNKEYTTSHRSILY